MGARIRRFGINKEREVLTHPRLKHSANAEMYGAGNARTAAVNAQGWNQLANGLDDLGDVASGIATNERHQEAVEAEKLRRENEVAANKMQRETEAIQRRKQDLEFDDMKLKMLERMNQKMDGGKSVNITGVSSVNKTVQLSEANNADKRITGSGFTGEVGDDVSQTRSENIRAIAQEEWENAQNSNYSEKELYGIKKKINSFLFSNLPAAIKADNAFQAKRKSDLIEGEISSDIERIRLLSNDGYVDKEVFRKFQLVMAGRVGKYENNLTLGNEKLQGYMTRTIGGVVDSLYKAGRYDVALRIIKENRFMVKDEDADNLELQLNKAIVQVKELKQVENEHNTELGILEKVDDPEIYRNPGKLKELLRSITEPELQAKVLKRANRYKELEKQEIDLQDESLTSRWNEQNIDTGVVQPFCEMTDGTKMMVPAEQYKAALDADNIRDQNNPQTMSDYYELMNAGDEGKSAMHLGFEAQAKFGSEWYANLVKEKATAKQRLADNSALKQKQFDASIAFINSAERSDEFTEELEKIPATDRTSAVTDIMNKLKTDGKPLDEANVLLELNKKVVKHAVETQRVDKVWTEGSFVNKDGKLEQIKRTEYESVAEELTGDELVNRLAQGDQVKYKLTEETAEAFTEFFKTKGGMPERYEWVGDMGTDGGFYLFEKNGKKYKATPRKEAVEVDWWFDSEKIVFDIEEVK